MYIIYGVLNAPVCALNNALPGYLQLCLTFAFRADTLENDIVPGKYEPMGILDEFLNTCYIFHVHIKNTAALYASYVIMIAAKMVETVGPAGNLPFSYLAHFA